MVEFEKERKKENNKAEFIFSSCIYDYQRVIRIFSKELDRGCFIIIIEV